MFDTSSTMTSQEEIPVQQKTVWCFLLFAAKIRYILTAWIKTSPVACFWPARIKNQLTRMYMGLFVGFFIGTIPTVLAGCSFGETLGIQSAHAQDRPSSYMPHEPDADVPCYRFIIPTPANLSGAASRRVWISALVDSPVHPLPELRINCVAPGKTSVIFADPDAGISYVPVARSAYDAAAQIRLGPNYRIQDAAARKERMHKLSMEVQNVLRQSAVFLYERRTGYRAPEPNSNMLSRELYEKMLDEVLFLRETGRPLPAAPPKGAPPTDGGAGIATSTTSTDGGASIGSTTSSSPSLPSVQNPATTNAEGVDDGESSKPSESVPSELEQLFNQHNIDWKTLSPEQQGMWNRIAVQLKGMSTVDRALFLRAFTTPGSFEQFEKSFRFFLKYKKELMEAAEKDKPTSEEDRLMQQETGRVWRENFDWQRFSSMSPVEKKVYAWRLLNQGSAAQLKLVSKHKLYFLGKMLKGLDPISGTQGMIEDIKQAANPNAFSWERRSAGFRACTQGFQMSAVGLATGSLVAAGMIILFTTTGPLGWFATAMAISAVLATTSLACNVLEANEAAHGLAEAKSPEEAQKAFQVGAQAVTGVNMAIFTMVLFEVLHLSIKIPRLAISKLRERFRMVKIPEFIREIGKLVHELRARWSSEVKAFLSSADTASQRRMQRIKSIRTKEDLMQYLREEQAAGRKGTLEPSEKLQRTLERPDSPEVIQMLVENMLDIERRSQTLLKQVAEELMQRGEGFLKQLEAAGTPEEAVRILEAMEKGLGEEAIIKAYFEAAKRLFGEDIQAIEGEMRNRLKPALQVQDPTPKTPAPAPGTPPAAQPGPPSAPPASTATPPAAAATPPASPTEALPKDPRGPPPASVADAATTPKPAEPPRAQQPVPAAPAVALDIAQTLQAIEAEAAKAPALSESESLVGANLTIDVPRLPQTPEVLELAGKLNESERAGRLSKAGEVAFLDPEGNTLTMRAKPDPAGSPGSRLWKRSTGEFWQQKGAAGRAFDKSQEGRYTHNQLYLDAEAHGTYYILDSYNPPGQKSKGGEIVSRKLTQLANISKRTALSYLNELVTKYKKNSRIADVPSSGQLAGTRIEGTYILEVPVQDKPVPQNVLDRATELKILIRDINMKNYNVMP